MPVSHEGLIASRFKPSSWLESTELGDRFKLSDAAKAVYAPLGAGGRACLGIHLAYMELRLSVAEFFRRCQGARLAPSVTPESMRLENLFSNRLCYPQM